MATGTIRQRIFANRIAALSGINGRADVSTSVNQESPAAGSTLYVLSVAGLVAGQPIMVNRGGDREEVLVVNTIGAGLVTTTSPLAYTHTLLQADVVEMGWYNLTITYVKSSASLKRSYDGPFPAIGAMAMEESPPEGSEYSGGLDEESFLMEIIVLDRPSVAEPTDQELDEMREDQTADVHKALMADTTCGGLAHQIHILSTSPIVATRTENDSTSNLPLIGIKLVVQIDFNHLRGNRYA